MVDVCTQTHRLDHAVTNMIKVTRGLSKDELKENMNELKTALTALSIAKSRIPSFGIKKDEIIVPGQPRK